MKQKLFFLIAFALFLPLVSADFSDLASDDKNKDAIDYLQEQNVINGYSDGTFKPDNNINRAELLKILLEAKGVSPSVDNYKDCFPDVGIEWFAPYVCYAKNQGWVNGYSDGYFRPADYVSKVEAIKMILEVNNVGVSDDESAFDDVSGDQWFAPYVVRAEELGLLEESGDFFYPGDKIKRKGVAENIFRLIVVQANNNQKFTNELKNEFLGQDNGDNGTNDDNVIILKDEKLKVLQGEKASEIILSDPQNELEIWKASLVAEERDFVVNSFLFEVQDTNGGFRSVEDFSLYKIVAGKIGLVKSGVRLENNQVYFEFEQGIDVVAGTSVDLILRADFVAGEHLSSAEKKCIYFSLSPDGVGFDGSADMLNFELSSIDGSKYCLDTSDYASDRYRMVESPASKIVLGGEEDIFVASVDLVGNIESLNVNKITLIVDELDTAGVYNGSDLDISDDFNAIKSASLYYADNTPVLTKNGSVAETESVVNNLITFDNLDFVIERKKDMSLLLYVSVNQISEVDIARSGMAFVIGFPTDNSLCDIDGATSSADYSCSDLFGDNDVNNIYVFNNKVSASLSSDQAESVFDGTRQEILAFDLVSSGVGNAKFTGIQDTYLACSDDDGSGLKITKIGVYQANNFLGSVSGFNLCNSNVNIDFSTPLSISSSGDTITIEVDIEGSQASDRVSFDLDINGSAPGDDDICWQDYGTSGDNGMEICWIDLGESSSTSSIFNQIGN